MVVAELALGEDHEAATVGGSHPRSLRKRRAQGANSGTGLTEKRTPPEARSGGVGVFGLVPHTGFEPVVSALRGRCPGPLDECGPVGTDVSPGRSA